MILKYLILAAVIFVVYKLFIGDKKKASVDEGKENEKLYQAGEMVKDPMCGAYVPKDGDIRVRDGENVHIFCSYECREKYIQQTKSKA